MSMTHICFSVTNDVSKLHNYTIATTKSWHQFLWFPNFCSHRYFSNDVEWCLRSWKACWNSPNIQLLKPKASMKYCESQIFPVMITSHWFDLFLFLFFFGFFTIHLFYIVYRTRPISTPYDGWCQWDSNVHTSACESSALPLCYYTDAVMFNDTWSQYGHPVSCMSHTFSKLANHQIRHLAIHTVSRKPGNCIWSL